MAVEWFIDPSAGDLYFPDGSHATNLGDVENPKDDAQQWALNIVSEVGLGDLSDEQMIWLLAITMGQFVIGPPPDS